MNEYAFFLGCIMPNRYPGIEFATRLVLKEFGINLIDMEGSSCCPAPGVVGSFDLKTWATLAARNLCIAEDLGCNITLCCNGCYATLQEANHLLKSNDDLRNLVNGQLASVGREYKGKIDVKHVIELLYDEVGIDNISKAIKKPLGSVKVATHYGCHFLKPSDIRKHGSAEKPRMLDEIVEATGAQSVEYKDKMMCCGAGGGVRTANLDISLSMTKEKLDNMNDADADIVVTPCIFCHLQFDRGQRELMEEKMIRKPLPVAFITQLIDLAIGTPLKKLGIYRDKIHSVLFSDNKH